MAVGGYVWDSGTKINALLKDMEHIEEFAKVGDRFTSKDGEKMERRIERLEHVCESHRVTPGHREQVQLNREIIRRLEKLEQGK